MQPPDALLKRGIMSLPTLGDGRQSGTSDSPSILNCSPESAAGGGLAWLRTGDRIRVDLERRHLRHAGERRRDRPSQVRRLAQGPGERHALAGALSLDGGAARQRGRHGNGGQVPRRREEDAAPQSLIRGYSMTPRLSEASLHSARSGTILPTYDRDATRFGIVHIGPGAFHRAHQAFYVDTLLHSDKRWAISALSLRSTGLARCAQGSAGALHAGRARSSAACASHRRNPRGAGRCHGPGGSVRAYRIA